MTRYDYRTEFFIVAGANRNLSEPFQNTCQKLSGNSISGTPALDLGFSKDNFRK